jgi:6,7-dimethyl-8-ribityllumazine synthase
MSQNLPKAEFKVFNAESYKVGIVVAVFNPDIGESILASALEKCRLYSIPESNITVHKVAGSVEIPVVLQALAETKSYDCLVALGTIIRGETPHFDYVAKIVSEGVLRVMLDYHIPIGFGVLTCENKDQALARVLSGGGALETALQTRKQISEIK